MFEKEKWTEEKLVNIPDVLLELVRSCKLLIIAAVCAAVLFAGWGKYKSITRPGDAEKEAKEQEEELQQMVDLAISSITETEREEVERIYDQLSTYQEYRKTWLDTFNSDLTYSGGDGEDSRVRRTTYRLVSTIEGVENMFATMALGVDDYQKIVELNPVIDTVSAAYDYVYVNVITGNDTQLTNMGENKAVIPSQYMLNVDIIGDTKETCDAIGEIVDAAFQRELKTIREVDKSAELSQIDIQYRGRIYDYIAERQQSRFETLQKIDTTISNLRTNQIAKLTSKQKEYFTILSDLDKLKQTTVTDADEQSSHLLRNALLGFLAGLFLACIFVIIRYLASGTIKINKELEVYYHLFVLDTFFFPEGGRDVLKRLIGALSHADAATCMRKARSVAVDLCGLIGKTDSNEVYLVQTCDDDEDEEVAAAIMEAMKARDQDCAVTTGMPLESIKDMESMIGQKNAVLLVHNKETLQAEVDKLIDFCTRHSVSLLGAVTISDL